MFLFETQNIGEIRCVKRSDLIEALVQDLPLGTIRFGCQILSVKLDTNSCFTILHLNNGNTIRAKVLIGCDGANSVVADFRELKPKKLHSSCAVRGFTYFPNGHGFVHELVRTRRDNTLFGMAPVADNLAFWFFIHQWHLQDSKVFKDQEMIKQMTLESVKDFPSEKIQLVKNCDISTLTLTHLRYHAPWDILLGLYGNPQRHEIHRKVASEETNEDFYTWSAFNRSNRNRTRSTSATSSLEAPTATTNLLSTMQSQSNKLQQYLGTPEMLPTDPQ
ncbi:monooxygenase 1-like [Pistacia vera]|uniref:monooxygenase 1-like n=1 Tax=Pistacia vera TaxID=55513 RepID=UPI001263600E|nr:monooxygenase 1-like [Pistacia vera]